MWASANAVCGQDAQRHAQEATGAQKLMAEEALKAKEMAMHEVLRAKEEAADKVQPNATPPACIPPHGQCTWTVLLHVSYHMDSAHGQCSCMYPTTWIVHPVAANTLPVQANIDDTVKYS